MISEIIVKHRLGFLIYCSVDCYICYVGLGPVSSRIDALPNLPWYCVVRLATIKVNCFDFGYCKVLQDGTAIRFSRAAKTTCIAVGLQTCRIASFGGVDGVSVTDTRLYCTEANLSSSPVQEAQRRPANRGKTDDSFSQDTSMNRRPPFEPRPTPRGSATGELDSDDSFTNSRN